MISDMDQLELVQEMQELKAESMGWVMLEHGVYLHRGAVAETEQDMVVEVVGLADAGMAEINVLWLV